MVTTTHLHVFPWLLGDNFIALCVYNMSISELMMINPGGGGCRVSVFIELTQLPVVCCLSVVLR